MNFKISGHRTAIISVHFITKSGVASLPEKAQGVNNLSRHLMLLSQGGMPPACRGACQEACLPSVTSITDMWFGVEHSVTDDDIYQC